MGETSPDDVLTRAFERISREAASGEDSVEPVLKAIGVGTALVGVRATFAGHPESQVLLRTLKPGETASASFWADAPVRPWVIETEHGLMSGFVSYEDAVNGFVEQVIHASQSVQSGNWDRRMERVAARYGR